MTGGLIAKTYAITENDKDLIQEDTDKIDLQSTRWRSAEIMECNTRCKGEVCSYEVKQPIEYFTQFFLEEVWQMICNETNLYAVQTDIIELKFNVFEV